MSSGRTETDWKLQHRPPPPLPCCGAQLSLGAMATAIKDGGEARDGEGERETGEGGYDEEKLPLTGKQITLPAADVIDGEERKVN